MNRIYLTPSQVSERYGRRIAVGTLANWRSAGTGPAFCRVGGRILYPVESLDAWERRRTVQATRDYRADQQA